MSLLVVAPIVAIYVTIDWDKMITTVDAWISPKHRDEVRALGREINDTVAGFVRGQTVICLILGVFYATVLRSVGLHHGIAIGLIAGLISFVPYLGAGTGFVISMCVAVSQFWPDWTPILVVGGTFFVGEMLADYVLAPRIIGRRVKLNPVWLMFALFAFGALFGFIGLLLAVPLAAAIGVLLRFAIRKSGAQTVKGSHAPLSHGCATSASLCLCGLRKHSAKRPRLALVSMVSGGGETPYLQDSGGAQPFPPLGKLHKPAAVRSSFTSRSGRSSGEMRSSQSSWRVKEAEIEGCLARFRVFVSTVKGLV